MDRFQAMQAFREVASHGGFAAAARSLNSSPPSISRLVSDLEDDLGVRLFNRSTRQVSLTEEGERFLRKGIALLDELESVSEEIRERRQVPAGHLRLTSVVAFGQERVAPILPEFMRKFPKVSVELEVSNRTVDLVQEHYDLAIRIGGLGGLESSSLKARKVYAQRLIFVATPGYIARYGAPKELEDLENHCVVKQISGNWGRINEFRSGNGEITYSLPERFVINSPTAARKAVLGGEAMGLLADYLVSDLVNEGLLERVLPGYETPDQPIYAVFVHRNYMPAKTRAFIEHLAQSLAPTASH